MNFNSVISSFSQNSVVGMASASFLPPRGPAVDAGDIPRCGWSNNQPVDSYETRGGALGILLKALLGEQLGDAFLNFLEGGESQGPANPLCGTPDQKGTSGAGGTARPNGLRAPGSLGWLAPKHCPPAAPAPPSPGAQRVAAAAPALGSVVQQQVNTNVTNVTNHVTINQGHPGRAIVVNGQMGFDLGNGQRFLTQAGMPNVLVQNSPYPEGKVPTDIEGRPAVTVDGNGLKVTLKDLGLA